MRYTAEKPTKGVPFDIVAEVTFPYRHLSGSFTVVDDSGVACISDERPDRSENLALAGDVVHIRGITDDTVHGIIYAGCRSLEVLSKHPPKLPRGITATQFLGGSYDHWPVIVKGFIRDSFRDEIDPRVVFFMLVSGGETIYAVLTLEDESDGDIFDKYVGAEVSIAGLCRTSAHGTRRQIGRFLKIENIDAISVLKPPSIDPFNVPEIRSPSPLRATEVSALGRRRAIGRVIAVWHGDRLLIRTEANRIVGVELAKGPSPRYGHMIEVAGLPETDLYNINLSRAIWRALPDDGFADESPTKTTATSLMFDHSGRLRINTGFHGRAIQLRGIVRSLPNGADGNSRLLMECDRCIVPIDTSANLEALQGICVGCDIEVSGTCVMEIDNWHSNSVFPHVKGFFVVVRTPGDIRIISRPSWWTTGRLLGIIGTLLAVLTGIFAWNLSLNSLAKRRGTELAEEKVARLSSDMKVGERTRLAIELHDSLSQNLTGVSLEIATATKLAGKDPGGTLSHLEIAAKSLKSCRDELRNCIWDLRNYALEERDMNDAVRRTLAPFVDGIELVVRFNVPRERLADDTAHALLRIIRELVLNSIRHGRAKTVRIAGCIEGDRLLFSVSDDGCGFDPGDHPGIRDGHFGLQGIRERINHFGGDMSVESEIGKGSKVSISLSMNEVET